MNKRTKYKYGPKDEMVLLITDSGYGMKMPLSEIRISTRGGQGLKTLDLTEKNGHIAAVKKVKKGDLVYIVTKYGMSNLICVDDFRLAKRRSRGVKAIKLRGGDEVIAIA